MLELPSAANAVADDDDDEHEHASKIRVFRRFD